MRIKAVIFDMDGVLIDARDWHFEALNQALRLFGLEISRYDHLISYDGLPTLKKLEMLSREHGLSRSLHSFINTMKQNFTQDLIHSHCKPVFQHQYTLAELRKRGYRLAVASNSVRNTVQTMLHRAGLLEFFEFCLSSEDVSRPKPDPEIYQKAILQLGLRPEECVVVEDNEKGIRAARGAGAQVLEVASPLDVSFENVFAAIEKAERACLTS